jgi:hypothetical protein
VNVYHHWGEHVHITGNHFIDHGSTRGGHFGGGNVYAGRDGHVYRRDAEGHWQQHTRSGGWTGLRGPSAEHEQSHQAREMGQQRFSNFNRGFGAHGFSASHGSSGGFHGGGVGGGFHGGGGFSGGGGHGGGGHR